jgi:D-alanyl-D-alanine endopeptidase (penicillin-binding protein 7)
MKKLLLIILVLFASTAFANKPVKITADSWIVADADGNIIEGKNTETVRAIASITKLVTAMVVLDANQSLSQIVPLRKFKKSKLTRKQLIDLALVHSDNQAADALCKNYPQGYQYCIRAMNNKVKSLGMNSTYFEDSTGLSHANVSTAEDLIKLVKASHQYPEILAAAHQGAVSISTQTKRKKTRIQTFVNTNPLVRLGQPVTVSKTGFNNASGGCLVMQLPTTIGERIVIVLGSRNTKTRFPEAEFLVASR